MPDPAEQKRDNMARYLETLRNRIITLQAEKQLSVSASDSLLRLQDELTDTLEELSVAQEELAAQDEQLEIAHDQVTVERERYWDLFEFAPGGYIVTDANGLIREANYAASRLLNMERYKLLNKPLVAFVTMEQRRMFRSRLNTLLVDKQVQEWETALKPRRKQPLNIAVTVALKHLPREQTTFLHWLLRDVTAQKQAEAALRQSQLFIQRAAEAMPDILFIYDYAEQHMAYVNNRVTSVLGYTIEQFQQLPAPHLSSLVHPSDADKLRAFDDQLTTVTNASSAEVIVRLQHADDRWRWIHLRATVFNHCPDGSVCQIVGVAQDVTERMLAEDRLRKRNRELATLNDISTAVGSTLNLHMIFVRLEELLLQGLAVAGAIYAEHEAPDSMKLLTSWGLDHALLPRLDTAALDIFNSDDTDVYGQDSPGYASRDHMLASVLSDETWIRDSWQSSLFIPFSSDGSMRGSLFLFSRDAAAFSEDRRLFWNTLGRQISVALHNAWLYEDAQNERRRSETLSRRLLEAHEMERRNIAMELHDEIGQVLTGLRLMLDMYDDQPPAGVRDKLSGAQAMVNDLIGQVRNLSLDLRPGMLDDLGLLPTLLWHVDRYTAQTGIQVECKYYGMQRRFDTAVETAAYRIVQEALTNVARYSHVDRVDVRVWANPTTLFVQVSDEGRGFDAEAVQRKGTSSGLIGMRERAALLGGRLEIDTMPDGGTCITAELPITPDEAAQAAQGE
ncbi:MAG: PAS domain S-box protein [Anaerolineae bacterium]|nr:PAS domain S-box protein [Anaerolineae bacterium]